MCARSLISSHGARLFEREREKRFPNSWSPSIKRKPKHRRGKNSQRPVRRQTGWRHAGSPRRRRTRRSGRGRSRSAGSPPRPPCPTCRRRRRRSSDRPRWASRGTGRCGGRTGTRRGRSRPEVTCPPSRTCTLRTGGETFMQRGEMRFVTCVATSKLNHVRRRTVIQRRQQLYSLQQVCAAASP